MNEENMKEINDRLITDIQTKMVMGFLEQGLIKEAKNKLEEFGLTKKEIQKLFEFEEFGERRKNDNFKTNK